MTDDNMPKGIFDMTPANAIIAPLSMLLTLDPLTADAIITLIRAFRFRISLEDRASIEQALDNPNFSPREIARIRRVLHEH